MITVVEFRFPVNERRISMRIAEFSQEQIAVVRQKIEQALWEIGLRVELAQVREMCAAAGAEVRGDRVHFSPEAAI